MKTRGKCNFCEREISGKAMTNHLASCNKRKEEHNKNPNDTVYVLRVSAGPFWLYLEVKSSTTLKEIDSFLREIWLACCGHQSMFKINNQIYASYPYFSEDKDMEDSQISSVLDKGTVFSHEYDFGTTTHLEIKCVEKIKGNLDGNIKLVARNNLPDFRCSLCNAPAELICTVCIYEGDCFFCSDCAKEHYHKDESDEEDEEEDEIFDEEDEDSEYYDEELFLPFVNSPRTGVCGYTGNSSLGEF